jgi:hypothetical protein
MDNAYDPYTPDFGALEAGLTEDLPGYVAYGDRLLQLLNAIGEAFTDQYESMARRTSYTVSAFSMFFWSLRLLEQNREEVFDRLRVNFLHIIDCLMKTIQQLQGGPAPPEVPAYDFDKWVADLKARSGPDRQSLGTDVWTALDVLADGFKEPGEGGD